MVFVLKSILSDMNIASPTFLTFLFTWNIFFHLLTLNFYVSSALRWTSCRQHIVRSCFFNQSATLCLLIGALSPLTFKVIIDQYVFIAILNLIFKLILCFSFLFLVGWFPFILCLCPFLFSFCEYNVWFWFVFALFFSYDDFVKKKKISMSWPWNKKTLGMRNFVKVLTNSMPQGC